MRLGKYQLLRKLATGGMAEVFLAKTDGPMGFEKLLVIKRILPNLAQDPQFIEMFLAEAKLAAQLNHPNLVQLFDFGQAEGSYFIAMEYIDGPTLRLLLARARDLQAPISLALAARIVSSAAEGLAYAHDFRDQVTGEPLHLVHRDVSPDNILVGRSGAVKLVDFGIAKARGQSHHTQAGTVKGKVAYMAPEQLRGEPLDLRVDLYALGVVLYELCTGRMPHEATSDASMVRAVLYEPPIPAVRRVPTLPPPLQAILDRLLAKDRAARYPDCRTLHTDLERFIQSTGEPTNGFALSRLVAQLAPMSPPTTPTPVREMQVPAGVTASAFAPTGPILRSEPVAGVPQSAPLEMLGLDRTVRSEPRRSPAPPMAAIEPRRADAPKHAPGRSAFVFPTALGEERGSAPVPLGLERRGSRREMPRAREGGGFLRVVILLALFLVLAAVGAYLGLAAAQRTDLLARMGLPVPGAPTPVASAPSAPAPAETTPPAGTGPARATGVAPTVTTPVAPASSAPAAAVAPAGKPAPAPPSSGTGAATASTPPAQAPPSPGRPATASPTPREAPPGTTAPTPREPAATTEASQGSAGAGEPAASAPGSAGPGALTVAAGSAARGEASPSGTPSPEPSPATPEPTETTDAPGPPAGSAGALSAAATETTERPPTSGSAEGAGPGATTSTPARKSPATALEVARRARRETDREKLLGAFAEVEAAKESTVLLESKPHLQVRMGGKILGITPVPLKVPASDGPVELEFFETGLGVSHLERLVLKPGDNGTHTVVIPRGKLAFKLQTGVVVSIDGRTFGTTPLGPVSLYEGRHLIQLTRGDSKERRTLDIRGNETEVLEYTFPEAE